MANIRAFTENRVEREAYTGARVQAADFSGGEMIGKAVSALGRAGQDYAQAQHEIALRDAETQARDADNQRQARMLDLLSNGESAFFNLQGRDALNAVPDLTKRRDEIDKETEEKLKKSPHALRMFKEAVARRRLSEDERIFGHVAKAREQYETTVYTQSVDMAISSAIEASDNPAEIERNLATVEGLVEDRAVKRGLAAKGSPEMDLLKKKVTSQAISGVAERMRLRSPGEAQAFIIANARRVDPTELTKLLGAIDEEAAAEQADSMIDNFLVYTSVAAQLANPSLGTEAKGPPSKTPVPADEVMYAAIGAQESGNRERYPAGHPKAGQLITSSAGAEGKMQVMPGTNMDPGYGVTPARDNSDAERSRVGRDYYKAMLKEYGGNVVLALTAYNWGPKRVNDHLKKVGDPRTGKISDSAFVNSIPNKEAREYAPSVLRRAGVTPGKGGVAATAEAQAPTYAGEEINLTATINKIDANDELTYPEKQALKAAAKERYGLGRQAKADAEARVKDAATAAVSGMGENFTSYDQIPLNIRRQLEAIPELKAAYMSAARANAEEKARKAAIEAGEVRERAAQQTEIDMIGLEQDNPEAFLRQPFDDFKAFPNLDHETRTSLMRRQGSLRSQLEADAKAGAKQTAPDMGQIRRLTRDVAGMSGSGMSNLRNASREKTNNRILFQEAVRVRVEAEQRSLGRKLNDSEVVDIMQNVALAEVTVIDQDGGTFGGRTETRVPSYQARRRLQEAGPDGQLKFNLPADVPKNEANRIAQAWVRKFGWVPDPEIISRTYRSAQAANGN